MEEQGRIYLDDAPQLILLGKALSSPVRIQMLELLEEGQLSVNDMAERLKIPASSAAANVKALEEARLISTRLVPGVRGSVKMCSKEAGRVELVFSDKEHHNEEVIYMPIGNYVDYKVSPTCGIVSERAHIDIEDEPRVFYNPRRTEAMLLWFGDGFVEYRFPNTGMEEQQLKELTLSAEMCSEAKDYNMDYPSDITVWINGKEAGTWTCPSDFGGKRGMLNPEWWPEKNTQYGVWKSWKINQRGTYIDEQKVSDDKVEDYGFSDYPYIAVRIGIKEDAEHKGGLNLFGKGFGNYAQDIEMKLKFK